MHPSRTRKRRPAQDPASTSGIRHDTTLEAVTNNFSYEDSTVRLRVGNKVFSVSKSRLTQRAAAFRDMFALPQPEKGVASDDAVVLHNDAEDFEHFLWFIHADAVDLGQLNTQPVQKQLSRYLGIATIAHMYEAPAITLWAQDRLFSALEHVKFVLPQTIAKLLRFARCMESARNGSPVALKLVDAVSGSIYRLAHLHPAKAEYPADLSDLVQVLEDAEETDLLAQVYYYLLVYREDEWMSDARLRPVDRQRLLCGSHTMRRKRIITCDGSNDREEYRKKALSTVSLSDTCSSCGRTSTLRRGDSHQRRAPAYVDVGFDLFGANGTRFAHMFLESNVKVSLEKEN